MFKRRTREGDSPEIELHQLRSQSWVTPQSVIAVLVFFGSIGGLYADNVSRHKVNEQDIRQLKEARKNDDDRTARDRTEMREEVKEVKADLKEIRGDVQKVLIELQRQRR